MNTDNVDWNPLVARLAEIAKEIGSPYFRAITLNRVATAFVVVGNVDAAIGTLEEATKSVMSAEKNSYRSAAFKTIAEIWAEIGHLGRAIETIGAMEKTGDELSIADAWAKIIDAGCASQPIEKMEAITGKVVGDWFRVSAYRSMAKCWAKMAM